MARWLQKFHHWASSLPSNGVSVPFLRANWNQPGQWVRGAFYKATTVNLLFMAVGSWLLIAGIILGNSEVRDGSVNCGTVFSPVESFEPKEESLAEVLGFTYTGPDSDLSQKLQCTYALADQESRVFNRVLPGGVMLLGAVLIAYYRDPNEGYWAPLRRDAGKPSGGVVAEATVPGLRPGWYPDQADHSLIRWFDGKQWTSDGVATAVSGRGLRPGWYPDQADRTLIRWFDGKQWTGATLPRGADGSADTVKPPPGMEQ